MVVIFHLFVSLALVDSTPQFGFGGFGNSQNCLGSRCNQNNLGGGGFGGFRGGFGGYGGGFGGFGGFGQNFGHAQNCVGSQCNQNNFGKKKREALVDGDTENLQSGGIGKSEEPTHYMKDLRIPNVEKNTKDAENRISSVDQVSTEDADIKLTNSVFDEVDSDIVLMKTLRGDTGNRIVEDGSEEDLVEEFELEEEVERAEKVLNLELETILDSAGWDSEKIKTHENVAASEAEDELETANNIVSIEPEETISASSIDKTTLDLKKTIQSLRVEDLS